MNIFIFASNWYNHGDESAIRALIDELFIKYPECQIKIQFNQSVNNIPYNNIEVIPGIMRPSIKRKPLDAFKYYLFICSGGRVDILSKINKNMHLMIDTIKWADIAIFAPGGPTIGDIYRQYQLLDVMNLMKTNNTPYFIYAPSMGPFKSKKRYIKYIIDNAVTVCFRESISQKFYKEISSSKETYVTLDSAFQHMPDIVEYEKIICEQLELSEFLNKYERVIGVTITDLQWHASYQSEKIETNIRDSFTSFINYLTSEGFGIVFIPQLFGQENDYKYMEVFANDNCIIIEDNYDCYFQQVLISKLHAVVGMRYHSNIFSAKMQVPFISIAYEQKMHGFMRKARLEKYCIDISELSYEKLKEYFNTLEQNYTEYKNTLKRDNSEWIKKSRSTTDMLCNYINDFLKIN
jgi:colanic acid/amylovoran biosynthesis protein